MSVVVMIDGDKRYLDALSTVARKHGTTMGKLLRRSVDAQYGAEIEQALSFFGPTVSQKGQSEQPKAKRKTKVATP